MIIDGRDYTFAERLGYHPCEEEARKAFDKYSGIIKSLGWECHYDYAEVRMLIRNEYRNYFEFKVTSYEDKLAKEIISYCEDYLEEEEHEEDFCVDFENNVWLEDKIKELADRLLQEITAEKILSNVEKYGITDKEEAFAIASDVGNKIEYWERWSDTEEEAILEAISSRKGE